MTEDAQRVLLDPPYLLFPEQKDSPRMWGRSPTDVTFPIPSGSAWPAALSAKNNQELRRLLSDASLASIDLAQLMQFAEEDEDQFTLILLSKANNYTLPPAAAELMAGGLGEYIRTNPDHFNDQCVLGEWAALIETRNCALTAPVDVVVGTAARWISWLEARGSRLRSHALSLLAADALYQAGQLYRAEHWLAVADSSPPLDDEDRFSRQSLRVQISRALQEAVSLPIDYATSLDADRGRFAEALGQLSPDTLSALPDDHRKVVEAAIRDTQRHLTANASESALIESGKLWHAMASELGLQHHTTPRGAIQEDTAELSQLLTDPSRGHDRSELEQGLGLASRIYEAAQANNWPAEQGMALWAQSVIERRLGRPGQAVDTLNRLWLNLEGLRRTVPDPVRRAGVFAAFPHLFVTLAAELLAAGYPERVLAALEGGKGRLLEDTLLAGTQDLGRALEAVGSAASETGAPLLRLGLPTRTHYLSFLCDEERTFAALETADGTRHATCVPLTQADIRKYAAHVDPSTWGRRLGGFAAPAVPSDLPERMAPLVSWLEPLLADGTLRSGDHLCYSSDEELHLIPLQLLTFLDQPLVETFSMSRSHGVNVLRHALRLPSSRPQEACVVEVPARDDRPEIQNGFGASGDQLQQLLTCQRLSGPGGTITALAAADLTHRVVHFTTHGTFPKAPGTAWSPDSNPYLSAGLLIANDGGLPSLGDGSAGLLTPNRIVTLQLSGSHVTTQACSCGLAREGAGGDALGVELAFLLAGAASVLTTHWDVALEPASEFCSRFYRAWLSTGVSRAAAWRTAAISLRREGRPPYEWAAFSLAGDWR